MGEKVAILDTIAQYVKLIDRRVHELHVESDILPMDTPAEQLKGYKAIILPGGPESVYDQSAPLFDPDIFNLGIPILGIGYSMQLMNYMADGTVVQKEKRQDGECVIEITADSPLFKGLDRTQRVLMSYGDSIDTLADGFIPTAHSDGLVAAIEHPKNRLYGVQFYPENDLTPNGVKILENFLYSISGFTGGIKDKPKP